MTVHPFRGFNQPATTTSPTSRAAVIAPPHNLDAEQACLGAVLLTNTVLRALIVEEGLRPEHFYRDHHRVIWAAMTEMSDQQQPVDVLTVTAHLTATGQINAAGGKAAIDELTGGVPGLGSVRQYARIVKELWGWRQRLIGLYGQWDAIQHRDTQAFEVAVQHAHTLVALDADESLIDTDDLARHMERWIEATPEPGLPIPIELAALGHKVRFRSGHVTVIAGWSHMGKTVIANQLIAAIGAAGHKAVIWTNEDTPEELVARHLQRVTGVPAVSIADRQLTNDQILKIAPELGKLPFGVQPCFGWDAQQIGRHIRQVRPVAAVVDHFHVLPGVGDTKGADGAMQQLVAAAGQTPCHLFVVCQLNQARSVGVVRPAPVGRDLRGTGQIYNLAHTVLLVHREEEELRDMSDRLTGRAVQLENGHLDVVKNKPTGRLDVIPVTFDERHVRFAEAQ
jgi:replicative DNA helicase